MEINRTKEQQKVLEELARQEQEIKDKREGIKRQRQLLQMEKDGLQSDKDAIRALVGEKEAKDELKRNLIETIHEGHIFDIDTAVALFPKATQRVLDRMMIPEDPSVIEAIVYERRWVANEIVSKWRNSEDFRAQMAVFRLVAKNDELMRLNSVQKKQLTKGDSSTMFDVQVLNNRADAAEFIEIVEAQKEREDEDEE